MDVLVTIDGREAIPVRAIPLLTDWQVLLPHEIADALTNDDEGDFPEFASLTAYQMQDGECKAISAKFWERLMVPKIQGLIERIQQETLGKKVIKARWQNESPSALPAGAFVWCDEFEACFWRMYGPNGETIRTWEHGRLIPHPRMPDIELDFSPFIPELEMQKLVMEGFEAYQEARRQVRDEFATSSDNWEKIDDCKDQIAQWEKQEQTTGWTPSKAHTLMVLRQKLKQLLALVAPAGTVGQPAPTESSPPSTTGIQAPATTNESAEQRHRAAHQPTWKVKKPLRNSGYNWLLYRLLNEAYGAGLPRPTARDVLEKWRCNKPDEITEVLFDGFKYLDSNGDTQVAELDAIRKAIGRMTSGR